MTLATAPLCWFGTAAADCYDYTEAGDIAGTVDTPGLACAVAVTATHAYVRVLSGLDMFGGRAFGVAVQGGHAYVRRICA